MGNREFTRDVGNLLKRLKRRLGGDMESLWINEWKGGQRHVHALLRTGRKLTRRMVREERAKAGSYRFSCKPVRNVGGMARYIVKHTLHFLREPNKRQ